MLKNSSIKIAAFALSAALAFSGCGGGGGDNTNNGQLGATGTTTGGAATTGGGGTTGGTTGLGLTGSTLGGGGGGSSGSSTTSGGATTATTTGTTTTATTTTTTTGGGGTNTFLNPVTGTNFINSLTNPTSFVSMNVNGSSRIFLLDGFRNGQSNGRLLAVSPNGATPLTPVQVTAAAGSDARFTVGSGAITSPFDIQTDGTNLYLSVGFGVNNEGAIVRVSNLQQTGTTGPITGVFEVISDDNGTTASVFSVNPCFMTLVGGLNGVDYVYWSEYSASTATGRVRRCRLDGTGGLPQTVLEGLNFPAGLDHDGVNLVICDSAGAAGNGQVLRVPLLDPLPNPAPGVNSATVISVLNQGAPGAQQAIFRPFDVDYDGNNGFFYTEGGAIQAQTGPAALGPGQGRVRFITRTGSTATIVNDGLTNAAGIDAIDSNDDGTSAVLFSEAIVSTGRVLRRLVNTNNIDNTVTPTGTDTGINNPLFVGIADEDDPLLFAVINYIGGQANGIFRSYSGN